MRKSAILEQSYYIILEQILPLYARSSNPRDGPDSDYPPPKTLRCAHFLRHLNLSFWDVFFAQDSKIFVDVPFDNRSALLCVSFKAVTVILVFIYT